MEYSDWHNISKRNMISLFNWPPYEITAHCTGEVTMNLGITRDKNVHQKIKDLQKPKPDEIKRKHDPYGLTSDHPMRSKRTGDWLWGGHEWENCWIRHSPSSSSSSSILFLLLLLLLLLYCNKLWLECNTVQFTGVHSTFVMLKPVVICNGNVLCPDIKTQKNGCSQQGIDVFLCFWYIQRCQGPDT